MNDRRSKHKRSGPHAPRSVTSADMTSCDQCRLHDNVTTPLESINNNKPKHSRRLTSTVRACVRARLFLCVGYATCVVLCIDHVINAAQSVCLSAYLCDPICGCVFVTICLWVCLRHMLTGWFVNARNIDVQPLSLRIRSCLRHLFYAY